MDEEIKIVARAKSGEMLKGYIQKRDLERFSRSAPVYLRLVNPGNTVGTMICQDQLSGLFQVKTFDGNKPLFFKRFYFSIARMVKKHAAIMLASIVMVSLSLVGLIAIF